MESQGTDDLLFLGYLEISSLHKNRMYWLIKKVCSVFSVIFYGKIQMDFFANPIHLFNKRDSRPWRVERRVESVSKRKKERRKKSEISS